MRKKIRYTGFDYHAAVKGGNFEKVKQVDEKLRQHAFDQLYDEKVIAAPLDDFVEPIRYEESSTYKPPRPASGALLLDVFDLSVPELGRDAI
ncbi:hypothetical protein HDU96_005974 [Phlyctochytrium bullatum]|nr:hypothetical protein HDU96_005974 [Phlyctochytrium bullatum]